MEQEHLLRCGNVFVFEKNASGISRWKDDREWDLDNQFDGLTTFIERTAISGQDSLRVLDDPATSRMRKTISDVSYNGITHHLVAYQSAAGSFENESHIPSTDPVLHGIWPREKLTIQ